MKEINWNKIKFIARPDTWYDEGSEAFLEQDGGAEHNYTSAYFRGIREGFEDGEFCCMFEFDWIDENGNCINSNIPSMEGTIQRENYIIENAKTGEKYNWLENKKL